MTDNLPALRPDCDQHGPMSLRSAGTKEQAWCGVWYACTAPRCRNANLLPSPELLASLEQQRAAFEATRAA